MTTVQRAVAGGSALGLATGWNVANTGAVAQPLADAYGIGLAGIGLFTSAFFATHIAMQIPAGKASDRLGPRRVGLLGLALIAGSSALGLLAPDTALALAARGLTGLGTGLSFIAGSAYVRTQGGSPLAQGLFGGIGLAGGGLALAVVPPVEGWVGWRAPFATALAVALVALLVLVTAPRDGPRLRHAVIERTSARILTDSTLYRLALLYAASLGLSVVVGNWVLTQLDRHGGVSDEGAGAIGALTLALGVVTRPLGGWILHAHPRHMRAAVGASLAGGALGTLALAAAEPVPLAVAGAALVGLAAGIPFAPAFTGAAQLRPDAQAASVGLVNAAGSVVALLGTPLLGLTFGLPGGGRAGFVAVTLLWLVALALLPTARQLGAAPTAAR